VADLTKESWGGMEPPVSGGGLRAGVRNAVDPVLFAYSQVLFTQNRWVGIILLAATFVKPLLGLVGLGSVLFSFAVVRLAHFSQETARRGLYGYNPLLVGLAIGAFLEPSPTALALIVLAVVAVVFLQTAMESALGYFFNLPVLSLPFVLVTFIVLAGVPFMKDAQLIAGGVSLDSMEFGWLPEWLAMYLRSLGAIFFSPHLAAGALVLAALALYSRIAVVLSFVGYAMGHFLLVQVFDFTSPFLSLIVGYNFILTAIALGGVWFVPQRSSFVFAAFGALFAGMLTAATILLVSPYRLPVLILPFNLTIIILLYAMRQRVKDGSPKAVDFAAGSPEVNLNYYRTRVARVGSRFLARFRLPFSGRWTVTQGVDGEHTHRGLWRHAWDFEVIDGDGENHTGSGSEVSHYHCHGLPVLAAGDGTVVKVVTDIPDNKVGERNPGNNWGNLVMIQHGPGLFSMVCHLAPGSIKVSEGQAVTVGTHLGSCGNSGRSFVPHLHFQFQSTPRVGAPTLEAELHDVVITEGGIPALKRIIVPEKGQSLRNLEREDHLAALFAFPIGTRYLFRYTSASGRVREEEVLSGIDLYNNLVLESVSLGGKLFIENQNHQFLVYDHQGPQDSVLYLMHAAIARVPFEQTAGLAWDDVLSRRRFRSRWWRWMVDMIDPFLSDDARVISYRATRDENAIEVFGEAQTARGKIRTFCRVEPGKGPVEMTMDVDGRLSRATLLDTRAEVRN